MPSMEIKKSPGKEGKQESSDTFSIFDHLAPVGVIVGSKVEY